MVVRCIFYATPHAQSLIDSKMMIGQSFHILFNSTKFYFFGFFWTTVGNAGDWFTRPLVSRPADFQPLFLLLFPARLESKTRKKKRIPRSLAKKNCNYTMFFTVLSYPPTDKEKIQFTFEKRKKRLGWNPLLRELFIRFHMCATATHSLNF